MMRHLAVFLLCLAVPGLAHAQTAIRPEQIQPVTPNITWGQVGTGYQIGSTVPWRTSSLTTPTFSTADAATIVELTNSGAITATLPDATGGFGDGFGFAILVGGGTLTLNRQTASTLNGKASLKIGPYQVAGMISRGGNWYADMSLPMPAAQTGATVLADNMTWVTPTTGGGGGCSESSAFLARAGTLDTTHQNAYNAMICALVTDGVWAKLDALWLMGTQTTAAANLNLKSTSFTLTPNGSPGFTADQGYLGVEGSTAVFLDTGFSPASSGTNYTLDAASFGVWSFTSATSTNTQLGVNNGVGGDQTRAIISYTDGNSYLYLNSATEIHAASGGGSGFYLANRPDASNMSFYRNGALLISTAVARTAAPSLPIYILDNNRPTGPDTGAGFRISMAYVGGSLTATQVTAFYNRVCTFFTAVRGSC